LRWLILFVLVGSSCVAAGAALRPIQQSCDPRLAEDVCLETIDAALRRGLPPVHPPLLSARAEPGPAARSDQFGHRATVTFAVLGVPGETTVRLYFDAGAHWGGIPSRGPVELVLWAAALGGVVASAAVGGLELVRRRRREGLGSSTAHPSPPA
jgi:hypothetical protein